MSTLLLDDALLQKSNLLYVLFNFTKWKAIHLQRKQSHAAYTIEQSNELDFINSFLETEHKTTSPCWRTIDWSTSELQFEKLKILMPRLFADCVLQLVDNSTHNILRAYANVDDVTLL